MHRPPDISMKRGTGLKRIKHRAKIADSDGHLWKKFNPDEIGQQCAPPDEYATGIARVDCRGRRTTDDYLP